jgi:hypothetical protein
MKKLFFSALVMLLAFSACKKDDKTDSSSSPTTTGISITSTDLGNAGDTMIMNVDTTNLTGFNLGTPGSSVTWDFSALGIDRVDTTSFLTPSTTPGGTYFPTSNMAMNVGNGNYMYLNKTTNDVEGVGLYINMSGNTAHGSYSDNIIMMKFPMAYNSAYTDSGVVSIVTPYSGMFVKMDMTQHINSIVDAAGTIKLPNNITFSCIREKRTEIDNQKIYIGNTQTGPWSLYQTNSDTTYSYSYYAKNQKWEVCTVKLSNFTTNAITEISYKK